MVMEPAPEVTLTMRGVVMECFSRGVKASTVKAGPVALVRKQVVICSERVPLGRATAALLTSTSSLRGIS